MDFVAKFLLTQIFGFSIAWDIRKPPSYMFEMTISKCFILSNSKININIFRGHKFKSGLKLTYPYFERNSAVDI